MNLKPTNQWIAVDPADVLRKRAEVVTLPLSEELVELTNKMMAYVDAGYNEQEEQYNIRAGIAIAAPQMFASVRIIYMHFDEQIDDNNVVEHKYLLANPKILQESIQEAYLESGEGCLSILEKHEGYVYRKKKILVQAYDLINHKEVEIWMDNLLSICFQHELDHLNGILFYDRINKNDKFAVKTNAIKIA